MITEPGMPADDKYCWAEKSKQADNLVIMHPIKRTVR